MDQSQKAAAGIIGGIAVAAFALPQTMTKTVAAVQDVLRSPQMLEYEDALHDLLLRLRVPPPHPRIIDLALVLIGIITAVLLYFLCVRSRATARRRRLMESLDDAKRRVAELEELVRELDDEEAKENTKNREVRIFMEGAFDLMHFGHMNAFRLGHGLGTQLIVGVNSSESIAECKGFAPVMTDDERCKAVEGCRFVDEVIPKTPYVMTEEYLAEIMEKYNIDYVVHGDDPCFVNGRDVYGHVKAQGKYRSIPRTEGVSTTDVVGRMLLCTSEHHLTPSRENQPTLLSGSMENIAAEVTRYERSSKFLTTSTILRAFSRGMKSPKSTDKIVYIDGDWDLFHAGHIDVLKAAREHGDYLIVGIMNDELINISRGSNYPILNLNERVLSVMGCKYVDDVLIDCPMEVDSDMLSSLKIDVVVSNPLNAVEKEDSTARDAGVFKEISGKMVSLTVDQVLARINENRERYAKKFQQKKKSEDAYYDQRYKRS